MPLSRREFLRAGVGGASLVVTSGLLPGGGLFAGEAGGGAGKYNVLFFAVDDLRPALGCYGYPAIKTPNIDALARSGMVFKRAYCQLPSCLPSRSSLLTGLRLETLRLGRTGHFRERHPKHVTLPGHFKAGGWHAMEFGKMFHVQDPVSWSAPKWLPKSSYAYPIYGKPKTVQFQKTLKVAGKPKDWWGFRGGRNTRWVRAVSWEDPDVPENVLFDGQLADGVTEALREVKDKRFFLAPGFFRPHLPFIAPKKYYDMYPPEKLKLPDNLSPAKNSPPFSTHNSAESRQYTDIPKTGALPKAKQLEFLRGYYASVTYVDAQIGKVLAELDRLGLRDNTVIALWGDHGYHFGEHGTWNKNTNFEEATRSTLIVSVPGRKTAGSSTDGIVEFVDIYPSLCDLCGLPVPKGLEGTSFAPLIDDPKRPWKKAAFSQARPKGVTGHSMRTDRYRYVVWNNKGKEVVEVYDHANDPEENVNIAGKPENAKLVESLADQFKAGWRDALPAGAKPY
jgi:arylsulfatase A-like enzyme